MKDPKETIDTFTDKHLTLSIIRGEDNFVIKFEGLAEDLSPGKFINPILEKTRDLAESKGKGIIVDLRKLDIVHSSTISVIVDFLKELRKTTRKIHLVYSRDNTWHKISLGPLEYLNTDDGRIRIFGD